VSCGRATPCPVVPLEVVDPPRAPGAGSCAAGRPAPGYVPEAAGIAAAAARATCREVTSLLAVDELAGCGGVSGA